MQVDKINIQDIIPAEYNPRQIKPEQLQQLQENMQRFGLVDPIIINLKNNHIIGGHQRYQILKQEYDDKQLHLLRLGDIGWVFDETNLKLNDTYDEKALNISLNNLSGEFQEDKLAELLTDLQEADYDITLTGFQDYEVYDIILNNETITDALNDDVEDDANELLNFTDTIQEQQETLNIQLYSDKQRQTLIQLVTQLKKEHPNKSIAENLTNYLETHIQPPENIQPYTIVFDNNQQKEKFLKYANKLKENKRYNSRITLLIQADL